MPSIVMSFAGEELSGDHPGVGAGLGAYEWRDVAAVMQYAIEQGAEQLVLFGWSMGATAALLALERASLSTRVRALVLIDPATSWAGIIRNAVSQARAPRWLSGLMIAVLSTPGLAQLAGAPGPVKFSELDWTNRSRLDVPTLVIHSKGDRTIPYDVTVEFVSAQAPLTTLESFEPVPHCAEYNAEPNRFTDCIVQWLDRHGICPPKRSASR
jgi:pimeloyl-ACP methyl ester carboxylesterase